MDVRPCPVSPHADARRARPTSLSIHRDPRTDAGGQESDVMFHPNQLRTGEAILIAEPGRTGACLVAGCTCKDARIVSIRRAAFFAAVARRSGETADRRISPEPGWTIPTFEGA